MLPFNVPYEVLGNPKKNLCGTELEKNAIAKFLGGSFFYRVHREVLYERHVIFIL